MLNFNCRTTVSFTGHRKLPTGTAKKLLEEKLSAEIEKAIASGYTTFLFGAAIGWDMLCGLTVKHYKNEHPHIKLIAAVPFRGQEEKWTTEEKACYHSLLEDCDEIIHVCENYSSDCYRKRNQYMVDNSSKIIAYYDGSFRSGTGMTVRMAEKQKLQVINLY